MLELFLSVQTVLSQYESLITADSGTVKLICMFCKIIAYFYCKPRFKAATANGHSTYDQSI